MENRSALVGQRNAGYSLALMHEHVSAGAAAGCVCLLAIAFKASAYPLLLMALLLAPFEFSLFFVSLLLCMLTRGAVATEVNQTKVEQHFRGQLVPVAFTWQRIWRIFEWNGDVCFVTFASGCFIPREAFASLDEAREFTAVARELKVTNGSVWRDEWNGRTFGVSASSQSNFSNER